MGVKLSPHDIFIDDAEEQERIIENLRMALNKMPFKMYFQFVYSPVNADEYETYLREKNRAESILYVFLRKRCGSSRRGVLLPVSRLIRRSHPWM